MQVLYICAYHNWRQNPDDPGAHSGNDSNQTQAYQLPLASLSLAQDNVLISVCDVTGRVAIAESQNVVNLYSCESGPFEHVCELRAVLPGHGSIRNIQLLHPWLAYMSENEVQVACVDVVKQKPDDQSTSAVWEREKTKLATALDDDVVDFVFDGASGRDLLASFAVDYCPSI